MQIITEFNLGDKVFVMIDNQVKCYKIEGITTNSKPAVYESLSETEVVYHIGRPMLEHKVFATKEELLASL